MDESNIYNVCTSPRAKGRAQGTGMGSRQCCSQCELFVDTHSVLKQDSDLARSRS